MPIPELWRITRFRLTLFYGAMFALGIIALLGLIYDQTAGYMTSQVDVILRGEAASLASVDAEQLPGRISEEMSRDYRHISYFGLFSSDGVWIVGNIQRLPPNLRIGGGPREFPLEGVRPGARAIAERLPWGEILVVGRDVTQLAEIRGIILRALIWSGAVIVVLGLVLGAALSAQPLRRIRAVREASRRIMDGDLGARLPVAPGGGEIDMLAGIVNTMLDEVHRLVGEVKSASDSLAHDLRTPLTRLRGLLYRIEQQPGLSKRHRPMIEQALMETDALLGRFRALLRISEIESRERRAGFTVVELAAILEQIRDLYEPVAADRGVALEAHIGFSAMVEADPELIFEAVNNLVDNALKFTPPGGRVVLRLERAPRGARLAVVDNGPGIPSAERAAVLQRYYRSPRDQAMPGSGLGLSIVAAIARLHAFSLCLEDAKPGLRVCLDCWPTLPDPPDGA